MKTSSTSQVKPLAAHVAEFVAGTKYSDIPAETARIVEKIALSARLAR